VPLGAECFRCSDSAAIRPIRRILAKLPAFEGRAIRVSFQPALRVRHNRLISKEAPGKPVHAGSHIRRRVMVIERPLLGEPAEFARIFAHETFHFAWLRLGNPTRREYEQVLLEEVRRRARGELGWSAESIKRDLEARDWERRTRRWRAYVCESFCDAAAWAYSGLRDHPEWTLAPRFRDARAAFFRRLCARSRISI
jgi:hypothetical protein